MRIEYHRTMLADHVRNRAFHDALSRLIVPGRSTVCDIGCGTGLLGFMAARLGARHVYMLETAEIAALARKLARHNGLQRRIEIVPAHSTEVTPPDKVDIVVSETLGNYPFEENIIETLNDARARYLKPDGVVMPCAVRQFVAPVINARYLAELATWDGVGFGLDFAPAKVMGLNNIYVRTFAAADLLDGADSAQVFDRVDLTRHARTTRAGEAGWKRAKGSREERIYGFALWWEADLVADITLRTGPKDARTHWEQLFLPLLEPMRLRPEEMLGVQVRSTTSYAKGTNLTWTATLTDRGGRQTARQSLDLNKGFLP